jgi:hypothetical protein
MSSFHSIRGGVGRRVGLGLLLLLVSLSDVGCSSPEIVPSKGTRPPTSPEYIGIYQKEPRKYERLGLITQQVTPEMKFDDRGDSTKGFEALKAQAAKLGANGLLLKLPEGSYDFLVLAGYKGSYYQVPANKGEPKTVMGEAIYVLEQ